MNTKSDSFSEGIDKLRNVERSIKAQISKRREYEGKNLSTSVIDSGIKSQFEEISDILKTLMKNEIESTQSKLSPNEINRRLSIIQDWSKNIEQFKSAYESSIYKRLMEKNKANLDKYEESSQKATNVEMNTGEMYKMSREEISKQDDMLDELHNLLQGTKKANQEIKTELDNQKPMIENLDSTMDRVKDKMKRAEAKLNQYVERSSSGMLMTIICIEIVLMLLIIFGL